MNRIYKEAVLYWGIDAQRWALIEEMGEVMQALVHERRDRINSEEVINELIDLQTTINMLRVYYVTDEDWNIKLSTAEIRLREKMVNNERH